MRKVKAVAPYIYKGKCNFKSYPYNEWKELGFPVGVCHYPNRVFHGLAYKYDIPSLFKRNDEARLRFVSGFSIRFDTYPDYAFHEVIPVVWDCWPKFVDDVAAFFKKHKVKTAIFTSSQTADRFRQIFPEMNIFTITEGVNAELYDRGLSLTDRKIDILEVGRGWVDFFKTPLAENINHIKTGNFVRAFKTDEEFREALSNTKLTINIPRCDVDKAHAGNIETLTQRYWECMLSRVLMVGRAPKELVDLIGYNPVVEFEQYSTGQVAVEQFDVTGQVNKILSNINDYQSLVDKNYEFAMKMAPWEIRIRQIVDFLRSIGYEV